MATITEGFLFALGVAAACGTVAALLMVLHLATCLLGRWRQAGERGYSYEPKRGWARVRFAFHLWTLYDL